MKRQAPRLERSLSSAAVAAAALLLALLLTACGGTEQGSADAMKGGAGHDHGAMGSSPAAMDDAAMADSSMDAAAASGFHLAATTYPVGVRRSLDTALGAYDDARELLAAEALDGLPARAGRLAAALGAAGEGLDDGADAAPFMDEARRAAEALGKAPDLAAARAAFAEVSRFLMPVVGADPELAAGRVVYSCPMTEGFNKWMQDGEEETNPYMGPEMATCRVSDDWTVAAPVTLAELTAHAATVHGVASGGEPGEDGELSDDVAFYTCPMHPSVKSAEAGQCPICGMNLVAVTQREATTGVIRVDERRRQLIGVKTEAVRRRPVTSEIRAVGRVTYDETRLAETSVKYEGWIGRLYVDRPGQAVRRGEPLFTLYSPQLYSAQQEFLSALESQRAAATSSAPQRADYLVNASRERLRLWDLTPGQIDHLAATGEPIERIPILSPVTGVVVEKNVVEGASVQPGMTLFRIAGLDRVWVEAEVYESELPLVEVGQEAVVTFPYLPGVERRGTVAFLYPYLDPATRTGRVRVELPNPDGALKPDMFAHVTLVRDLGEKLVVPEQAVLYAGPRSFVFVDLGEGRLKPQQVQTGRKDDGWLEILSGLEEGDVIVTSGNFLIAAESRLKSAIEQWQ